MDIATASVIIAGTNACIRASRPALYLAVAHVTRRDPITKFTCDADDLRTKICVTYATPSDSTAGQGLNESASPAAPPRLTVLQSSRPAAGSPHKP